MSANYRHVSQGEFSILKRVFVLFFEVALLITDGKQTSIRLQTEPGPKLVANAMKNRGIEIIALGIALADPIELNMYASKPEYILYVPNFSQLDAKVLETAEILCPSKLYYDAFMN